MNNVILMYVTISDKGLYPFLIICAKHFLLKRDLYYDNIEIHSAGELFIVTYIYHYLTLLWRHLLLIFSSHINYQLYHDILFDWHLYAES